MYLKVRKALLPPPLPGFGHIYAKDSFHGLLDAGRQWVLEQYVVWVILAKEIPGC